MVAVKRSKWFLFFIVFTLFLELVPTEAEAARRAFGRRGGGAKRGRNVASQGRRRNNNRNNFRNIDPFILSNFPIDPFSSLTLDPTGDLQRLRAFQNLGVDRFGNLFVGNQLGNGFINSGIPLNRTSNGLLFSNQNLPLGVQGQVDALNRTGDFTVLNVGLGQ